RRRVRDDRLQEWIEVTGEPAGDVHGPERVDKPAVLGGRVNPPGALELEDAAEPLDPGRIDQVLLGRLPLRVARLPPGGAGEGDGEGDVLVNRVGDERRAVVMSFAQRGTRIHLGILARWR